MDFFVVMLAVLVGLGYLMFVPVLLALAAILVLFFKEARPVWKTGKMNTRTQARLGKLMAFAIMCGVAGVALAKGAGGVIESAGWRMLLAGNSTGFRSSWEVQTGLILPVLATVAGLMILVLLVRICRPQRRLRAVMAGQSEIKKRVTDIEAGISASARA